MQRVAAAGRVLRARHRRAAPDLGGARAGHPQPDRRGARAASSFPRTRTRPTPEDGGAIRLAVAGRPNVGKSTLINTWLGEERLVAFDQPGTTRDAITVPFERNGQKFELIDTAGLRRKGKVFEAIEKFSVVKTLQAIADRQRRAAAARRDPGRDRPGRPHRRLHPRERPRGGDRGQQVGRGRRLPARDAAALDRAAAGVPEVRRRCCTSRRSSARAWARCGRRSPTPTPRPSRKMPTPVLTRLLHEAVEHQAPKRAGAFRPKLRYAHQGGMNPPRDRDPRQLAGARDRRLQALPRRPLPRALQAGRHAAAHRDALVEESVRRQGLRRDCARWQSRSSLLRRVIPVLT